jgi:hypothetical protein
MTPTEIIKADCKRTGLDPNMVLGKLGRLVQDKACYFLQEGKFLLAVIPLKNGKKNVEIHLYGAGTLAELPEALKKFIKRLNDSDADMVYGDANIPPLLNLLKRLGADVQKSDDPRYFWMAPV